MQPVHIMNRLIGVPPSRLTPKQRRIQLVMDFDTEVCNGGWDQYLYNSSGDGAEEFRILSRLLDYNGIADALSIVANQMGGCIPVDRNARIAALKALKDGLSESAQDQIATLIQRDLDSLFVDNCSFIAAHINELAGGAHET